MKNLVQTLTFDEYMRFIDLRENKIPLKSTKDLIEGLRLNKNIVNLDLRDNPWFTDSFRTKLAIRLVKNIDTLKKRREILKQKWINVDVLKIKIPENMNEIIQNKYKVEVNNNSFEAKERIIGNPTSANFKNYKHNKSKKESVSNNLKENVYKNDWDDYFGVPGSRTSANNAWLLNIPSKADFSISNMQFNNSVVKYVSPAKKRSKKHNQTTYLNNSSYNGFDRFGMMSEVHRTNFENSLEVNKSPMRNCNNQVQVVYDQRRRNKSHMIKSNSLCYA